MMKNTLHFILLEPPSSTNNAVETEIDVNIYKSILLPCAVTGYPRPTIVWFRQNSSIIRKNIFN